MKTHENALFRAGIGAALLALTPSCSGDMGRDSNAIDTDLGGEGSELELASTVDKAQFPSNPTYDGFPVRCSTLRRTTIEAAEARSIEIVNSAHGATTFVFFDVLSPAPFNAATNRFRNIFAPGVTDLATLQFIVSRMGQKLNNIVEAIPTAVHTCHDEDESVVERADGSFDTCAESQAKAATDLAGDDRIRWCDEGLQQDPDNVAVTLAHELAHQNRTADDTGTEVRDNNNRGLPYNAQNISRWLLENVP